MIVFRSTITRKLLVSAAVSMAILFGQSVNAANHQAALVPDDSLFYFGTGKPVPVEQFFAMVPDIFNPERMGDLLPDSGKSESQQQFIKQIGEFFKDPAKVTERWGMGDELQFSAYTVGVMPVLRIAADDKKFEAAMAKLSEENEIKFERLEHKGIDIRISAPEDKDAKESKAKAPDAAEIAAAEAELAAATAKGDETREALKTATNNLDVAKEANDASGIAAAANEIAAAAGEISSTQEAVVKASKKLAKLQQAKKDFETLQQTGGKSGPGMIIAADGKDIVFALSYNAYDPEVLDQLLGLAKPKKSLETSGKLKKIRKEWSYGEEIVMYIDNQLIADALTGGESKAAEQLQMLMADEGGGMQADLAPLAAEPCRSEIRQMAANVPMMVSGNRKFDVSENSIELDGHFALLLEHEVVRNTLQLMRGVVPVSQSSGEAMLSFGMGLNVNNLPQLSGEITDILSQIDYKCDFFQPLNSVAKTDISAASMGAMMFSGMARGIKGFSVNLYDADVSGESKFEPVKAIDAAIAIAADDPATLMQTLKMLPQTSMLSELPLDGSAMSLNNLIPVPLPEGIELFAAIKGKNIVVYSGEQAAEFANRVGGNGKEGFIVSSINTAKFVEKIESSSDSLPDALTKGEDMEAVLEMMKSYPVGNISYGIDFTDRGIEFESNSAFKRPKK